MGKGRAPCCDKSKVKKGPWSSEEDLTLISFIQKHGHHNWRSLPRQAGLLRCGKSCRLRWINYLRPDVKRGNFTPQEEDTIVKLHHSLGNKWSKIASHLPGRTDNEIKNVWNTHLKKRVMKKDQPEPKGSSSSSSSCAFSPSTSVVVSDMISNNEGEFNDQHADMNMPPSSSSSQCLNNMLITNSPTSSSYGSNLSNLGQFEINSSTPNVDPMTEIPMLTQSDQLDLWDLLDTVDPPTMEMDNPSELECQKWLTYFEDELLGIGPNSTQHKQAHPPISNINTSSVY